MTNKLSIIKGFVLYFLFCVELFVIFVQIYNYIDFQNLITINWAGSLVFIGLFYVALVTQSLMVGSWVKGWLVIIPPAILAIVLILFSVNFTVIFATILAALVFLVSVGESYRSYMSKNNLIKFEPTFIMRPANKALLTSLCIIGGVIAFSAPAKIEELNLGHKIAISIGEPIKKVIQDQITKQLQSQTFEISGMDLTSPDTQSILKDMGLDQYLNQGTISPEGLGIDITQIIETQVNNLVNPYRFLFRPIFAIGFFGLFQLYGFIAYVLFVLTAGLIFAIAKSTGFLHVQKKTVEQETLTF